MKALTRYLQILLVARAAGLELVTAGAVPVGVIILFLVGVVDDVHLDIPVGQRGHLYSVLHVTRVVRSHITVASARLPLDDVAVSEYFGRSIANKINFAIRS